MDVKDLVTGSDASLPQMSTTTYTAQDGGKLPSFQVTQSGIAKFAVSGVLSVLGMYYLATGKKEGDLQKMLLGAAFSMVALFMF